MNDDKIGPLFLIFDYCHFEIQVDRKKSNICLHMNHTAIKYTHTHTQKQ